MNCSYSLIPSSLLRSLLSLVSFDLTMNLSECVLYTHGCETLHLCLPFVQRGLSLPLGLFHHFSQGFPTVLLGQTNLVVQHPPNTTTTTTTTIIATTAKNAVIITLITHQSSASTGSQQVADLLSFRSGITSYTRKTHITL